MPTGSGARTSGSNHEKCCVPFHASAFACRCHRRSQLEAVHHSGRTACRGYPNGNRAWPPGHVASNHGADDFDGGRRFPRAGASKRTRRAPVDPGGSGGAGHGIALALLFGKWLAARRNGRGHRPWGGDHPGGVSRRHQADIPDARRCRDGAIFLDADGRRRARRKGCAYRSRRDRKLACGPCLACPSGRDRLLARFHLFAS